MSGETTDECATCGAELYGSTAGGSSLTPLEEHILDHSDPHGTLDLVPRTWFGSGAPSVASGYRRRDWYVDVTNHMSYVYAVDYPGGTATPSWVRATPDVGVDPATLTSTLAGYATLSHLSTVLEGYVSDAEAALLATKADLNSYATLSYLSAVLADYVKADSFSGYVTVAAMNSAISTALGGYVTSTALASALASYLTQTAGDGRYVLKTSMSEYAKTSDVTAAVAGRVFRHPTSPGVYPDLDLDNVLVSALAPYLTAAAAASAYATKAEISGLVDANALASALAGYVTPAALATALSPYATLSYLSANFLTSADLSPYAKLTDVAASANGKVFRSPTSAGVYPDLNLDNVLTAYLTTAAAASTYATKSEIERFTDATELAAAVAPLVRAADMPTYLSGYATSNWVTAQLLGYLSTTSASQLYATKAWVNEQGFSASAVYRSGTNPELNLDTVLNSWPVSSVSSSSKPPTSTAVKSVTDALSTRIAALEDAGTVSVHEFYEITGSSYGSSTGLVSVGTTRVSGYPVSGKLNQFITPRRFRMNYVTLSGTDALNRVAANMNTTAPYAFGALSTRLQIMLGRTESEQSAASAYDARLCIRFVANASAGHTGAIPWTSVLFVTVGAQTTEATVLGTAGDLTGIVWGDTVVFAFTEVAPGVYAATRKVFGAS